MAAGKQQTRPPATRGTARTHPRSSVYCPVQLGPKTGEQSFFEDCQNSLWRFAAVAFCCGADNPELPCRCLALCAGVAVVL